MWAIKMGCGPCLRHVFDATIQQSGDAGLRLDGRIDFPTGTVYVYEGKNIDTLVQWDQWADSVRAMNAHYIWRDGQVVKSPYSLPSPDCSTPSIRSSGACYCQNDYRCNNCLLHMLKGKQYTLCECGSKAPRGQNHAHYCPIFKSEFR